MCGRFSQSLPASAYADHLGLTEPVEDRPGRFNMAPSLPVAVITRRGTSSAHVDWCTWGFVPRWARDPHALKTRPINARIETVADKPMFRDAWRRGQRGLVPVDGFYEWRTENRRKQPWFIRRRDGAPLLLAALWEARGPDRSLSCTLLVGPPNPLVARFHDRMPVIVARDAADRWLDPNLSPEAIAAITAPCAAELLEAYPVSMRVNKPDNDGPECIVPVSL
ncbi:MAG: SOS response-associated peptidase [Thiohalomonadaceae bacterium]